LLNISNNIAKLNTGVITSYALFMVIAFTLYMLFYVYITNEITILVFIVSLSLSLVTYSKFPYHKKGLYQNRFNSMVNSSI